MVIVPCQSASVERTNHLSSRSQHSPRTDFSTIYNKFFSANTEAFEPFFTMETSQQIFLAQNWPASFSAGCPDLLPQHGGPGALAPEPNASSLHDQKTLFDVRSETWQSNTLHPLHIEPDCFQIGLASTPLSISGPATARCVMLNLLRWPYS